MPIYGRGLRYASPSGVYKDAYAVPERTTDPNAFGGFGQEGPRTPRVGLIVSAGAVLVAIGLLVATVLLKKEGG